MENFDAGEIINCLKFSVIRKLLNYAFNFPNKARFVLYVHPYLVGFDSSQFLYKSDMFGFC